MAAIEPESKHDWERALCVYTLYNMYILLPVTADNVSVPTTDIYTYKYIQLTCIFV